MTEQNFEFVIYERDEKTRQSIELGTFKDVAEAAVKMQKLAKQEAKQLKKNGNKLKVKTDEDLVEINIINQTLEQNLIFYLVYRDLKSKDETRVPNLSELVDDYVGNLPWFP